MTDYPTPEAAQDAGRCSYNVGAADEPYRACGRPMVAEWRQSTGGASLWVAACARHDARIRTAIEDAAPLIVGTIERFGDGGYAPPDVYQRVRP